MLISSEKIQDMRSAVKMLNMVLALSILLPAVSYSMDDPFLQIRQKMVERDIKGRGITDKSALNAMLKVERHLFVAESLQNRAYADHPLPISEGQTISQPYVVALMTQSLGLKPGDRVLEIGTGSGYQAAVLAEIVKDVFSIEIRKGLADDAAARIKKLGYDNVTVKHGDGYFGWKESAPFDAIIVTAAANHIPPPLIRQLKDGGRLVIPLGSTTYYQNLTVATKRGEDLDIEQLGGVRFVPMVGEVER